MIDFILSCQILLAGYTTSWEGLLVALGGNLVQCFTAYGENVPFNSPSFCLIGGAYV